MRLVFGSCRVGDPQPTDLTPPWSDELKALGIDALWTYSKQLQRGELEWPDALLLLGDQVYADEVSPEALEFIRRRRDTDVEPGEQIADFEEYTQLYRETWSDPDIRWLLSTVPTTMIFDDHDVTTTGTSRGSGSRRCDGSMVGRADHRRVHGVLGLPASRQPLAARARRGDDACRACGPRRRRSPAAAISRGSGTASRPRAAGVLPRLRRHAPARPRLAGGPSARRRATADDRRRRVGLDRRALGGRVRPPRDREHVAGLSADRDPPPAVVERGTLRRPLGPLLRT